MTYELLKSVLREGGETVDRESLSAFLSGEHPADIAAFLQGLDVEDSWQLLQFLDLESQAKVFGYLDIEQQLALARHVPRRWLVKLVTEMNSDDRADLFARLKPEQQQALLPALAQAEREDIRRLAGYAEGTAGAIMTSDYATLTAELTAEQAIDKLRREAPDKETIYRAYVIDEDRRLIGSVRLQNLILAEPNTRVEEVMERQPKFVQVDDDQESVARAIAKYDILAVPVLDREQRLVGIVTHDDAMDVVEEEATEDMHKVATIGKMATSVRDASFALLYRKRIAWLVLLVFGNIFSGAGIAYFEDTIAAYVALVFFLPLLIDSGGNAGSQAATLMVRALATGDVEMRHWGQMLGRELAVAAALGVTMALAVSAIGLFRGGPEIAIVVASTMVIVVIIGSLIGMSLPFLLSRLRLDPATASAPLITSIADAAGVLIYFGMATAILSLPTG